MNNNNSISDNSTTGQTTQEDPIKQIPIQNFDGHWKEVDLPEEKDITGSQWFEIIIKDGLVQIQWLWYYDQFSDDYGKFINKVSDKVVWGLAGYDYATWQNPTEEVTEYSFVSIQDGGYYTGPDGSRIDNPDFQLVFTYKNGRLQIERKSLGDPHMRYRTADIIYFEKISD